LDGPSAGSRWGSIGDGMVAIFEEHAERIRLKYTLAEWYALDPLEKAMMIAVRRIENAMRGLQSEAESKAMKKGAKK